MGFYQRWVVPRLIDLAMRNRSLDAYRQRTIGAASGRVLEIGVGSGQNLPLYESAVNRVYAIDPSMELLHMARNRIAEARLPVSLIRASAEQIPLRGRDLRHDHYDLDAVLDTKSGRRADRDAARSQSRRKPRIRGARPISGIRCIALAASLDPMLEAHRRRLPSRPQNGRPDPICWVPPARYRDRLYERSGLLVFSDRARARVRESMAEFRHSRV